MTTARQSEQLPGRSGPPVGRRTRAPRPRHNRRRPEPLWRRMPPARVVGRAALGGVRRALPALLLGSLVAGSGAAGYTGFRWLTSSPRFAAQHLELRGLDRLDPEQVREGLRGALGVNLFRLDTDALERGLLTQPWIAAADVRRSLPDRLVIEIQERRASGVAEMDGLYLLDRDGVAFKRADVAAGETAGLPIVTGIDRDRYVADPDAAARHFDQALALLRLYRAVPDRPRIAELAIGERGGITLITYDDAVAIRLGTGTLAELAVRLRSFDAAWAALAPEERRTARTIRVAGSEDRVTVAFAGNQGSEGNWRR